MRLDSLHVHRNKCIVFAAVSMCARGADPICAWRCCVSRRGLGEADWPCKVLARAESSDPSLKREDVPCALQNTRLQPVSPGHHFVSGLCWYVDSLLGLMFCCDDKEAKGIAGSHGVQGAAGPSTLCARCYAVCSWGDVLPARSLLAAAHGRSEMRNGAWPRCKYGDVLIETEYREDSWCVSPPLLKSPEMSKEVCYSLLSFCCFNKRSVCSRGQMWNMLGRLTHIGSSLHPSSSGARARCWDLLHCPPGAGRGCFSCLPSPGQNLPVLSSLGLGSTAVRANLSSEQVWGLVMVCPVCCPGPRASAAAVLLHTFLFHYFFTRIY